MGWCFDRLPEGGSIMEIKEISMRCTPEEVQSICSQAEAAQIASDEKIDQMQAKFKAEIQKEVDLCLIPCHLRPPLTVCDL